jgi:hypothetical protein
VDKPAKLSAPKLNCTCPSDESSGSGGITDARYTEKASDELVGGEPNGHSATGELGGQEVGPRECIGGHELAVGLDEVFDEPVARLVGASGCGSGASGSTAAGAGP